MKQRASLTIWHKGDVWICVAVVDISIFHTSTNRLIRVEHIHKVGGARKLIAGHMLTADSDQGREDGFL